jgi:hypothetical protein
MSLFMCEKCFSIENTAVSDYYEDKYHKPPLPVLCSECKTGKWHGRFPKRSAVGMLMGEDNFLYSLPPHHTNIVGIVRDGGIVEHCTMPEILDYIALMKTPQHDLEEKIRVNKMLASMETIMKDYSGRIICDDE